VYAPLASHSRHRREFPAYMTDFWPDSRLEKPRRPVKWQSDSGRPNPRGVAGIVMSHAPVGTAGVRTKWNQPLRNAAEQL
jgi:hypothetical protein